MKERQCDVCGYEMPWIGVMYSYGMETSHNVTYAGYFSFFSPSLGGLPPNTRAASDNRRGAPFAAPPRRPPAWIFL